jgi:hypothetical protein
MQEKHREEIASLLCSLRVEGRRLVGNLKGARHDCHDCSNSGIVGYKVDINAPVLCNCLRGKVIRKIILRGTDRGKTTGAKEAGAGIKLAIGEQAERHADSVGGHEAGDSTVPAAASDAGAHDAHIPDVLP